MGRVAQLGTASPGRTRSLAGALAFRRARLLPAASASARAVNIAAVSRSSSSTASRMAVLGWHSTLGGGAAVTRLTAAARSVHASGTDAVASAEPVNA